MGSPLPVPLFEARDLVGKRDAADIAAALETLPVRDVWGIGWQCAGFLERKGINPVAGTVMIEKVRRSFRRE